MPVHHRTTGPPARPSDLTQGWAAFYADANGDQSRPILRTYGSAAEKFYEAFSQPLAPERAHKAFAAGPGMSMTWGIGGSDSQGQRYLEPKPSESLADSHKRILTQKASGEFNASTLYGSRGKVFNAAGQDVRQIRSDSFTLENMLQKKASVPEEIRTDKRTIHRMAPPGLKGYMGSEYSNDYFRQGHPSVPAVLMKPSRDELAELELKAAAERQRSAHSTKTFKQKRADDELAEQVDLVSGLRLEYEYLDDDEDMPRPESEEPAPASE